MGRAIANASNAAQGWRKPRPAAEPAPKEEPTMAMGKMGEGLCGGGAYRKQHAGNKYRAKNDDGSRKSRKSSGGMSDKHRSPTAR